MNLWNLGVVEQGGEKELTNRNHLSRLVNKNDTDLASFRVIYSPCEIWPVLGSFVPYSNIYSLLCCFLLLLHVVLSCSLKLHTSGEKCCKILRLVRLRLETYFFTFFPNVQIYLGIKKEKIRWKHVSTLSCVALFFRIFHLEFVYLLLFLATYQTQGD